MKRAATKTAFELVANAVGREVPTVVNGRKQQPYAGIQGVPAKGRKAAPPIPSAADYPKSGDKRVPGPIIDPGAGPMRHVDPRITTEARK